ncbi:hypothetical protein DM01DRAFT_1111969 [Hesseltinella vesiculosa]|uniref:Uncharacterized protein n=1 Tax=Hesseltinella vesiculosa TaxID=101127 RepID=A0A1X2G9U1_9FUNG|nr:hypothetical protein DM01DRAFT_1111969 [Hesseltinella vesiculosa]
MHQHLKLMDHYLRFHFGPQWQLRLKHNVFQSRRPPIHPTLAPNKVAACLANLPFIAHHFSLKSHGCLCSVESIPLEDDLQTRLTHALHDSCRSVFPDPSSSSVSQKFTAIFSAPRRHGHNSLTPPHTHSSPQTRRKWEDQPLGQWHHALLFCREKLVVTSRNKDHPQSHPISPELLYFLQNMVVDMLAEPDGQSKPLGSHPQAIHTNHTTSLMQQEPTPTTSTSPPSMLSTSTPGFDHQHQTGTSKRPLSLFSYAYDTSSSPFKIQTKGNPTQVSPSIADVPEVSWSNPPPLIHSHLLARLPKLELATALDDDTLVRMPSSSSSSMASVPGLLDEHTPHVPTQPHPLPPNAKAHYQQIPLHTTVSTPSFLSSSLPRPSKFFGLGKADHEDTLPWTRRRSSTSSSPLSLSRRPSLGKPPSPPSMTFTLSAPSHSTSSTSTSASDPSIEDDAEKATFTGLVKIARRWVHQGQQRIIMSRICCIPIDPHFTAILLFSDESLPTPGLKHKSPTPQQQIKLFNQVVQSTLKDFLSFLLVKEAAHFTILSFVVQYPGLVHFVYLHQGTMTTPRLVDLNDLDRQHEMLQHVYQSYRNNPVLADHPQLPFRWPTQNQLGRLHTNMLHQALNQHTPSAPAQPSLFPPPVHCLLAPSTSHHGYDYLSLASHHDHLLMAVYYHFVPDPIKRAMHQQLFHDLCQRQPST